MPDLTSPLLQRPGAVDLGVVEDRVVPAAAPADGETQAAGDGLVGVAAHYGDPMGEQRRLAAGEALVDLSHRGVLTVTGPDRLSWLHSLTSQHLTDLLPGESAETLVLTPKGHLEHALNLVDEVERVCITVETARN